MLVEDPTQMSPIQVHGLVAQVESNPKPLLCTRKYYNSNDDREQTPLVAQPC